MCADAEGTARLRANVEQRIACKGPLARLSQRLNVRSGSPRSLGRRWRGLLLAGQQQRVLVGARPDSPELPASRSVAENKAVRERRPSPQH